MNRRSALLSLFALLAIGIALISRFAGPMRSERALAIGLASLRDAQNASGLATVAVLFPGSGADTAGVPVSLHGAFRLALPTATSPGAGAIALTWLGGGGNGADAYVEARAVPGGTSYVRLDRLPLPALSTAGESLNGRWWELDRATSGSLMVSGVAGVADAATSPEPSTDAPAALTQAEIASRVARVKDAVASGDLFVTDGNSASETVDGSRTFRIMLGLRRDVATALLKDLREALLGRALSPDEAVTAEKDAAASAANVTVWVDQHTGRLVQLRVDLDNAGGTSRSIQLQSLDLTTPVTVDAPSSPKPFSALMEYFRPVVPAAEKKKP